MARPERAPGQTLMELALVLPCFCLGIFMAVQLIWFCHNMIELQRMAQVMSDRVSYENYRASKRYTRFESLWGRFTAPQAHFTNAELRPWRPFHGISVVREAGRLIRVRVNSDLLPGPGFTKNLAKAAGQAFAETILDPPIPPEE